jgi:hypothetical protein
MTSLYLLVARTLALGCSFGVVASVGCTADDARDGSGSASPNPPGKADGDQPVEICAGVMADNGGATPASDAIQACLDATPDGGELALPPGAYRVTGLIRVGRGITLHTAGVATGAPACLVDGAPPCATLRADTNLVVTRGFVQLEDANVTVEHIVIDGNRHARLSSDGAHQCAAGNNGPGFNAISAGCTHCTLLMSATINALCGSGFEWNGADAFIGGNLVRDNGDHTTHNMWSDGITVTRTENAQVVSNYFADNSDVDLILGANRGGLVRQNTVVHGRQDSFAGVMLDNFNDTAPGDFVDAQVVENTIACNGRCDYGIQIGPHPWYLSSNIRGGTVAANAVDGARMGIDVDGAGTPDAPTTVTGNHVGPSPSSASFLCGTRPSARFNVAADSVVDLGAGPAPDAALTVHDCP